MKRILLVDNDPLFLKVMAQRLEAHGHPVQTATDGLMALCSLKTFLPDIIFTDLIMPKIDGEKLCRIIAGIPALDSCFVVIVSGAISEAEDICRDSRADAFVAKESFGKMTHSFLQIVEHPETAKLPENSGVMSVDKVHRRQITRELLDRTRHLEGILERTDDGIMEIIGGKIVYANAAATTLFAMPLERLLAESLIDFFQEPVKQRLANFIGVTPRGGEDAVLALTIGSRQVLVKSPGEHTNTKAGDMLIFKDITEQKHNEARFLAYQEQLRGLSSERIQIEERERRRIANNLHDCIGQALALAKIKLETLMADRRAADVAEDLVGIHQIIAQTINDTRSLTFELSPPVLYELGLAAALEWQTEQIQAQYDVQIDFKDQSLADELGDGLRSLAFQAARELMLNLAKHAGTQRGSLSLSLENQCLEIRVCDEGLGFDPIVEAERTKGFGLFSIQERLRPYAGRLEIDAAPGKGTCAVIILPL